jgi:RNA polymerase sigma factor (sigma-70 family)
VTSIVLSLCITVLSKLYSQEPGLLTCQSQLNRVRCRKSPQHQVKKQRLVPFTSGHGNKTDTGAVLILEAKGKLARFEQTILPHLDAAYNLARWLTRDEQDAQDMVQEAYLRAFKFFDAFRGGDGRAWVLTIVRNTCYTWLHQNRAHEITTVFDEETHSVDSDTSNPATLVLRSADHQLLRQALDELPVEFREVMVLRDLEGFSYKEIGDIANIPTGTVMSRLARARERLKKILRGLLKEKL